MDVYKTMNKKLLFSLTKKDFEVQTFRSGGKGGQHQNKTESGVRIIHKESEAVGECREHREQNQNKRIAFERLVSSGKFKIWHARKCNELLTGETLEEKVEKIMDEKYIKTEGKNEAGKWIPLSLDDLED